MDNKDDWYAKIQMIVEMLQYRLDRDCFIPFEYVEYIVKVLGEYPKSKDKL